LAIFFKKNFKPNIQNEIKTKNLGAGSGFLVSADGLIVTNRHVVEDKDADYSVTLTNGKEYTAVVLARDAVLDVALIKITAVALPYLTLGNSDSLKLGESVVAIGNALGQFQNTISVGVVSGLSRSLVAGSGGGASEALDHVIQTDAAINPGNSGGPLLNLSGEVVGVNVAIVQGSQNIGFSLPINSIKGAIASVRTTGKIVRPYLGVRYVQVTADLKVKDNLSVDYGVLVQRGPSAGDLAVIPGSPADKAGIVENDIILSVDGVKLDDDHNMASIIRQKNIGDRMMLTVLSKGVQKTVTVFLQRAPQE
jgi:serine protease Do